MAKLAFLSLNFKTFFRTFLKATVYDPLRKWMDNCYRGVPLGGLGSVLSAFCVQVL